MYWKFKNWIYLSLESPFKTMKKLKGVFKPLKLYFRCGKDWYPVLWCSIPSKIHIMSKDVMWKDKFDTPRYECCPCVWIYLFGFNLVWYWDLSNSLKLDSKCYSEDYWEQVLWYLYYTKSDINKAIETWPWENSDGVSTWNNIYLEK